MTKTELKNLIKECLREEMGRSKRKPVSESGMGMGVAYAHALYDNLDPAYKRAFELDKDLGYLEGSGYSIGSELPNRSRLIWPLCPKDGYEGLGDAFLTDNKEYPICVVFGDDQCLPIFIEHVEDIENGNIYENVRRRANEGYRRGFR